MGQWAIRLFYHRNEMPLMERHSKRGIAAYALTPILKQEYHSSCHFVTEMPPHGRHSDAPSLIGPPVIPEKYRGGAAPGYTSREVRSQYDVCAFLAKRVRSVKHRAKRRCTFPAHSRRRFWSGIPLPWETRLVYPGRFRRAGGIGLTFPFAWLGWVTLK